MTTNWGILVYHHFLESFYIEMDAQLLFLCFQIVHGLWGRHRALMSLALERRSAMRGNFYENGPKWGLRIPPSSLADIAFKDWIFSSNPVAAQV